MDNVEQREPNIQALISSYVPRTDAHRARLIDPILHWLNGSRTKDRFDVARLAMHQCFKAMEEGILAHFSKFAGGPEFIHKDEAWRLACRQREFVRECCARMAELPGGIPTTLSEEIRAINIGPSVKIIPDYSRKAQ